MSRADVIAYLGPEGTFTHQVANILFPHHHSMPFSNIPDTIQAITSNEEISYAVVPIENGIEGTVHVTMDWLIHHVHVPIQGEFIFPIHHALLVHPSYSNLPLTSFTKVLSHPQALAQCRHFIRDHLSHAEMVYTESTAHAAMQIGQQPEEAWLAIGTADAARLNQLSVYKQGIEDYENNHTRFMVIGDRPVNWHATNQNEKLSMLLTLPADYPGALALILALFSRKNLNLCYIQSRPTKTGLGNYFFWIDCELPADATDWIQVITEIKDLQCDVRILGAYPSRIYDQLMKSGDGHLIMKPIS
ncbi:prephenate dehydratase [Hazenella sp. IB182357]|uniref:Prephenate dehydratase n=1 Tax=Polycladospora coralii TaxID=2771432 RepID=A0A926NE38_9BACL|nr:prephenate dehydratase [Polycladospora coralii]MBD1371763.1 prephenate dehydratase [Polycladospora coralii]